MLEQITVLLALTAGLFDDLPLELTADIERALRAATAQLAADAREHCLQSAPLSDADQDVYKRQAEREADRRRSNAVIAGGRAIDSQDALPVLASDAGAALGYVRKDQDARRLLGEVPVRRVQIEEVVQRPISAGIQLRLAMGGGSGAGDQREYRKAGCGR